MSDKLRAALDAKGFDSNDIEDILAAVAESVAAPAVGQLSERDWHIRLDEAKWWREQTARFATTAFALKIMNERVENYEHALLRSEAAKELDKER